jgi:Kef-type K+ transport system membrane component KefB
MQVSSRSQGKASVLRVLAGYALMLLGATALFWAIMSVGANLEAPAAETVVKNAKGTQATHVLPQVLFALVAVIGLGRVLGSVLYWLGQPPVIGEVVAGILLGPSLLGKELSEKILPGEAAPFLGILAQLGVILYMFVIGLQLNAGRLRQQAHATVAISHASIVVPFILGVILALWLYPRLSNDAVPFNAFALFLGVSMSVTAFPVLARILSDRGMTDSNLGVVALACAAADDVTAWCLLAFVVGVVNASVGITGAITTALLAISYIAFMFLVVRPLVNRFLARSGQEEPSAGLVTGILLAVLVSSLATEMIGIHAVFGAFLLGAVLPHDAPISQTFSEKLGPMAATLLLPAFFAYTGMRTEIGLVSGWNAWMTCGLIILVATLGKFGGTYAAARLTGHSSRMAAGLGVLMNTRGLMELVVLNIGLDLGVISPKLFAMLVIMAVVTTVATTPILQRLNPNQTPSPIST